MPWIEGDTWGGFLLKGKKGKPIPLHLSLLLAQRFVNVMRGLESRGFAHCDISSGNIAIDLSSGAPVVELLDLEDMFLPSAPPPDGDYVGSPGYQHRSKTSVWGPVGDRFAATIMAAEMLVMADANLAREATETGFFGGHATGGEVGARFAKARAWIGERVPQFTDCLDRAWHSNSLKECPSIAELHTALINAQLESHAPLRVSTFTFKPWDDDFPLGTPDDHRESTTATNGAASRVADRLAPPPSNPVWKQDAPPVAKAPVTPTNAPRAVSPRTVHDSLLKRVARAAWDHPLISGLAVCAAVWGAAVYFLR